MKYTHRPQGGPVHPGLALLQEFKALPVLTFESPL